MIVIRFQWRETGECFEAYFDKAHEADVIFLSCRELMTRRAAIAAEPAHIIDAYGRQLAVYPHELKLISMFDVDKERALAKLIQGDLTAPNGKVVLG